MRSSVILTFLFVLASCASKPTRPVTRELIGNTKYTPQASASVADGSVQLMNGRWDGPSDTGFSHPYVSMMPDFTVYGDIDGDGNNEAVVIVHESGGGSGIDRVVALFGRVGEEVHHLGSVVLGNRVQVRSVHIQPGQLTVEYVRQTEGEPLCCPTEVARTRWSYVKGAFSPISDEVLGKLRPELLKGTQWILQPPTKPAITLTYADGRFMGETGCNQYSASVKDGAYGGAILVESARTTLRICDSAAGDSDINFLQRLQHATRMGFRPDLLWMSYDLGGEKEIGTLEFKEATKPISSQP